MIVFSAKLTPFLASISLVSKNNESLLRTPLKVFKKNTIWKPQNGCILCGPSLYVFHSWVFEKKREKSGIKWALSFLTFFYRKPSAS